MLTAKLSPASGVCVLMPFLSGKVSRHPWSYPCFEQGGGGGGVEEVIFRGHFQTQLFYDVITLNDFRTWQSPLPHVSSKANTAPY